MLILFNSQSPTDQPDVGSGVQGASNAAISGGMIGRAWSVPAEDQPSGLSGAVNTAVPVGLMSYTNGSVVYGALTAVLKANAAVGGGITTGGRVSPTIGSAINAGRWYVLDAAISSKGDGSIGVAMLGLATLGDEAASAMLGSDETSILSGAIALNNSDADGGLKAYLVALTESEAGLLGLDGASLDSGIAVRQGSHIEAAVRGVLWQMYQYGSAIKGAGSTTVAVVLKGVPVVEIDSYLRGLGSSDSWGAVRAIGSLSREVYSGLRGFIHIMGEAESGLRALSETGISSGLLSNVFVSVGGGMCGEVWQEPSYYDFDVASMESVSSQTSQSELYTVIRVLYDYDYSTSQHRKSLTLGAEDQIKVLGIIVKEIDARWVKTPKQAYDLGCRYLGYYARSRWATTFSTDFQALDTYPGVWVTINHPEAPIQGRVMVLDHEINFSSATLGLTVEGIVGEVPKASILSMTSAFDPVADGITINYSNGQATIRILSDTGKPIVGATVTLDGTEKRSTDGAGQVIFEAKAGAHHLNITATGYVPIEADVVFQ